VEEKDYSDSVVRCCFNNIRAIAHLARKQEFLAEDLQFERHRYREISLTWVGGPSVASMSFNLLNDDRSKGEVCEAAAIPFCARLARQASSSSACTFPWLSDSERMVLVQLAGSRS
jgi:hypothetical protein